jgi:outer membrane protein assembly factor BamB
MTDLPAGHRLLLLLMMLLGSTRPAAAQQDNPVYVDDSPRAWELFQQARDQAADNEAEAVRLYQELLDDYGDKLIPVRDDAPDHFVSARDRVLDDLRANESLLGRYRLMQTRQAQRLLEEGDLSGLAMTRPLTEPGLDATLRLAQEALESARFHAAVTRLEAAIDDPDLTGRSAAQCWFMLGLARHYLHRDEPVALAEARLMALGAEGRQCLEELTRLIAAGAAPSLDRASTSLDRTATRDLDELVAQSIWSVELEDSALNRRFRDSGGQRPARGEGYDRLRSQGTFTTAAAAVSDALVFINEGHTIRAFDRYSGRSAWPRPFTDLPELTIPDPDNASIGDLNLIAVEGSTLVTLTGHARAGQRTGGGRVLCLEASTGQLRWAVDLGRLGAGEEDEGLFPHGRPVIFEGAVYVLARKLSRQLLTGSYVVGLDLESGGLRWIRHLASSGSQNRAAKPFSTLVEDHGNLFAASPVGAVARLDADTGMIRWLVRFPSPMNLRSRPRLPWELSAPVVVGRQVFAITPDERRIVILDRDTGAVTNSFDARSSETWNAPTYLLAGDRFVYAVGSEIRAFPLDAPHQLSWRLPAARSRVEDGVSATDDLTLAGRVQLANGALIVPAQRGVLIVDGETGRIIHQLPVDGQANPVAIDAQLILASADSVDAYMSLGRAEQMLRRRIAEEPDDPSASLSLLQLGMRVGKLDLALQAADLTVGAIEAGLDDRVAGEARRELFSLLLEIHRRRLASTTEQGEALYERFDAVARTAAQRVEHLLAYGDWLASRAPAQAVEAYQAILSDPILASDMRGEGGVLRPASLWAATRLGALIDEHGEALYVAQAEKARRTLTEILTAEPTDADALLALALEFPFTDASPEAAVRAAQLQRRRGDHRRALAVLSDAYHVAPRPRRAERLLGPFLETCPAQSHRRQARLILQTILSTLGDLQLDTDQGPRRVGRWLAELAAGDAAIRLPRIGDHGGPAEVLDGTLLPLHPAAVAAPPPDRALLLQDQELRLIGAESLQELWTTTLDHGSAELIDCDEEELLLWVGPKTENPRLDHAAVERSH